VWTRYAWIYFFLVLLVGNFLMQNFIISVLKVKFSENFQKLFNLQKLKEKQGRNIIQRYTLYNLRQKHKVIVCHKKLAQPELDKEITSLMGN
jgi:hypothetical protein